MKVPVRVPRVVAPGARMVVDAVSVQVGARVLPGDCLMRLRIGNLAATFHAESAGVVQDMRAAAGDELMPDRVALWLECDALPPLQGAGASASREAPAAPAGTVVFRLPEVLLRSRTPRVQRVLVGGGATVLEVSMGPVRFSWKAPVDAAVAQVLVKEGDELAEGMVVMRCAGDAPATPVVIEKPVLTRKLEIPELTLAEFRQRTHKLRERMEQLTGLVSESGLANSAALLQAESARLAGARFTVAVVGEFKRGKSTFLNALAGGEFLPNDVIPCTAFACRFQYGERLQLVLLGNNGVEAPSRAQSLAEVVAELDRLTRDPNTSIREAIVRLPLELCRDGVDLVDTPGLNDSEAMNHVTLSVLPNVDAAVLLLIPESPLSDTERRFLEEHLLARDVARILFVLNAKDRVPPAKLPRLADYLQGQIQKIVGARDADSALDARLLCVSARGELAQPGNLECGFIELRQHLNHLLFKQRGRLMLLQSLQRVRRAVSESMAAVQLRMAQLSASRESFQASLLDVERQLSTTRLHSNELRRRLMEAQAKAEAVAVRCAQQLHLSLLSLRESLPPQVTMEHTKGGAEKVGERLGSALQQNAGRFFQHAVTGLMAEVRGIYTPMARDMRSFIAQAEAAFVAHAANAYRDGGAGSTRATGELEMPDSLGFGGGLGVRVGLSVGALSWLYLMESAGSIFMRGELSTSLEAHALEKLRENYGREIERQVRANASEALLTVRFTEFARRPFNELVRRLDQELKVLLDDALATLTSLRATSARSGDAEQMRGWEAIYKRIASHAEECEAIVFAAARDPEKLEAAS
jgi:GTPase SAR1 family protein